MPGTWNAFVALGKQRISPLVNALVYLRSNGYVHRDVKPENVLFDDEGRPKLSDMGLARPPMRFSHLTDTGQPLARITLHQSNSLMPSRDKYSADIYSIGVLLHELITGTLISCVAMHARVRPRGGLGGGIGQIVLGCVQSDSEAKI